MTSATFVKTWVGCLEKPFGPKAIQLLVEELLVRKQLGPGCCASDASIPKKGLRRIAVLSHMHSRALCRVGLCLAKDLTRDRSSVPFPEHQVLQ